MMKNKLADKISSIHAQIEALEKELTSGISTSEKVDRTDKLNLGSKMFMLQELNAKLFTYIEIFLETGSTIDEIPEPAKSYYFTVEELKKPVSETDTEEFKKIKEFINNYKNGA